jgi:hypothetical protein
MKLVSGLIGLGSNELVRMDSSVLLRGWRVLLKLATRVFANICRFSQKMGSAAGIESRMSGF